jgi:hypothetical protein
VNFPLELRFRIVAISAQASLRDASGHLLCYVKQKAFKLKEAVTVFGDEAQQRPLYHINADRVLDISAQYRIDDLAGRSLGVVRRRGMRSFWRALYEIHRDGRHLFTVQEENPWVKVADGLLTEIPVLGLFAGYLFHPAYRVSRHDTATVVLRVVKRPAFLEGVFRIDAVRALDEDDERLAVLGVLMVLLLERRRG